MERGLIAPRPVKHRLRDEVARARQWLLGLAGSRKSGAWSVVVARGHRDHSVVPLVVLSVACAAQIGPALKGGSRLLLLSYLWSGPRRRHLDQKSENPGFQKSENGVFHFFDLLPFIF